MKNIDFTSVTLTSGYWLSKENLNREATIRAVYEQFEKTGRIQALNCDWREGQENRPHVFWDSDVAKWIEGAAYILAKHPNAELETQIDSLIEKIRSNQCNDGYFNTYFISVEPAKRFFDRDAHELYCAGHLIEAAIACDKIGKPALLECMEKYIAYIYKIFTENRNIHFSTPGHEEIELALLRLYRHNGNNMSLKLAEYFINTRGTDADYCDSPHDAKNYHPGNHAVYNQSHLPVREQKEAVGHSVRAIYLYTAMAMLAKETYDSELLYVCRSLFNDIIQRKMYITGGVGSTAIDEAFTNPFDLPNDTAYAETCAAISVMFFCRAMLESDVNSRYADAIERAFYNGVLSGISLDGKRFFYVNPLEINLNEHFKHEFGEPKLPITQRPEIFGCSCCPPNLNRLLASLGNYLFGIDNGILYIHQYTSSNTEVDGVSCNVETDYPTSGLIRVKVKGATAVALRIPEWCSSFTLNKAYVMEKGYAVVQNDGTPIELVLDMTPRAVFADSRVSRDSYKLCIMRGPVLYCAETADNENLLSQYSIPADFEWNKTDEEIGGLPKLKISAFCISNSDKLYTSTIPKRKKTTLNMIPYSAFANRGECDMRVWFHAIF